MSIIHPNTLFHFTSKCSTLKLIVKSGLRFSYCFEEMSNGYGFAVPMICFSDIPLLRTLNHRHKYGSYMVGFDKKYLKDKMRLNINPVQYRSTFFLQMWNEDLYDKYIETTNSVFSNGVNKFINEHCLEDEINNKGLDFVFNSNEELSYEKDLLSLTAMLLKHNLVFSKKSESRKDKKIINNYDEREWRIIPLQYLENSPKWELKIKEEEYVKSRDFFNKSLSGNTNAYVTLKSTDLVNCINFIIVKKDQQIPSIIRLIRNSKSLFGCEEVTEEQRNLLISRVTSFETIENNY